MSQIIKLNKQYRISIGTYLLQITNLNYNSGSYNMPICVDKFVQTDTNKSSYLINYMISLEEQFIEPKELPVAGADTGPYPYSVYKMKSGDYLWVRKKYNKEISLVYLITDNWSSWKLLVDHSDRRHFESFTELAYIFPYSILNKGGILFHGVVMEWRNVGIIVCAHSGVGKTTHTSMWKEHENALILNGDRALCCKENNRWYTYGAPWHGSSEECMNRKVGLKAVVILEQANNNQICILDPLQGALELIQLTFAPIWEEELKNYAIDTIDNIAQNIPVLKLMCKPELEAVAVLKAKLEEVLNLEDDLHR